MRHNFRMNKSHFNGFRCFACGTEQGADFDGYVCPACGGNLELRYDWPDAEGRWSVTMRLHIDTQLAESRMPQIAEAATA